MTDSAEHIKGTLLLSRMKFLRSRGEAAVEAVLGAIPDAERKQLRGLLLPSSWYPVEVLRALEAAIVSTLNYSSRDELFLDMGRATATANLTGAGSQRAYVREGDPQFLLRHSPHIYASAHTSGTRSYDRTGEHSAVLRTTRPEAQREDCLTTIGWLERAIEIAGGRDVRILETSCASVGAPCCEYRCEWRLPTGREA
jgi:uncharacterized protein (TIGR02265 family)